MFCDPPTEAERHFKSAMKYLMQDRTEGDTKLYGSPLETLVAIMNRLRTALYEQKALNVLFIFNERFCDPPASDEVLATNV